MAEPGAGDRCDDAEMHREITVRAADERDLTGLLALAGEVEQWFGPMVAEPGFHRALGTHVARSTALVAQDPDGTLVGGLLFDPAAHRGGKDGEDGDPVHHLDWLVIAERVRGTGVGRALLSRALERFVRAPATVEVITFGADHPGAEESGARIFYERAGFVAGAAAEPGPEGGTRQYYRLRLTERR
jgi:GNAT superfamily N-acetyltransferase